MRFLFVTWAGGGNSTPVLGLGTRLLKRGHDVMVVGPDNAAARFAAVGIDYEHLDLTDPSFAAAAQPFRDEYDPTAQLAIDEPESL